MCLYLSVRHKKQVVNDHFYKNKNGRCNLQASEEKN